MQTDLAPGTRLGRWIVQEKLGQGGMGAVYKAQDPERGVVALKLVLSKDPTHQKRFEREARGASAVRHENVAETYGLTMEGGILVLALELLTGGSLRELVRRQGPLPWREAATIGAGIAHGLAAIHEKGFVHRDLKPANVLLDAERKPKITDFGLVRRSPELTVSQSLTKTGEVLGTLAYMAPEQADQTAVDFRADLYSLGATLYELLAGRPPFDGQGLRLLEKHLKEKPRPVRELVPDVPPELDRLVLALLAKEPLERPESAEAVALELEEIAEKKSAAPRGKLLLVGVGALALLATVAVFAVMETSAPPPPPEPTSAPSTIAATPKPPESPEDRMRARYGKLPPGKLARLGAVFGHEEMRHSQPAREVVFARIDGKMRLVSGGYDGHLKAWDPDTGKEEFDLVQPAGVRSLAVSGDGKRAVVGTVAGEAVAWDLAGRRKLATAHGASGHAAVAISWDGQTALSVVGGSPISRWRVNDGFPLGETNLGDMGVWFLRFTPDGQKVAVGGNGGLAYFQNVSGEGAVMGNPRSRASTEGVFTRNGHLVTIGDDRTLVVQDPSALGAPPLRKFAIHQDPYAHGCYGLDVLPDGKTAVTGAFDGRVELWDLESDATAPRSSFRALASYVLSVSVDPETGKRIATGGQDGTVRVFDLEGREIRPAGASASSTHRGSVISIALSRDSTQLLTSSEDGTVKIWDAKTGEVLATRTPNESAVHGAAFIERGGRRRFLSLGAHDDDLALWGLEDKGAPIKAETHSQGAGAYSLAVSANGERAIVSNGWWATFAAFDVGDELRPLTIPLPPGDKSFTMHGADLTPNGARAIMGREGHTLERGNVVVFDLASGTAPILLPGHPKAVVNVVKFLDSEGSRAVSCGDSRNDPFLRCWDVARRAERWSARMDAEVTQVAAKADLLAAVSGDKLLLLRSDDGTVLDTIDLGQIGDRPSCCAFDPASNALWVGTGLGCVVRFELTR